MTIPTLSTAPTTPQRLTDTPAQFVTNMDAWLTYEGGLYTELNAWAAEVVTVVSGLDFKGTSTTSTLIGTGSKTFTTQAGKLWQIGQFVIVAYTTTPANYMYGQVTAYSSTSLTVNVTAVGGSGTQALWSIGVAPANGASLAIGGGTLTGALTTATPASGQEAFIVPHGAAPSSPTNGSIWSTVAGWFARLNGATHEFVLRTLAQTLTNKSIDLASNTLTGTLAQFNTALSGEDFASLTGIETLTNKTLTSPAITDPVLTGTLRHDIFAITDGAGFAIDPRNGDIQTITLGANRTPTVANFNAGDMVDLLIDDGTVYSITWTTIGVTWIGGTAPTLRASGYTKVRLYRIGATYYGEEIAPTAAAATTGITYVGGTTSQATLSGTVTPTISLTALTGGSGTAPIANDLVVVAVSVTSTSDLNIAMTTAGYTEDQDLYANGTNDTNLAVYYKKMGVTPDTDFTLASFGTSGNSYAIAVQVFRGVDTSVPLDVVSTTATGTASVLVDPPAATAPASGSNCLVLIGGGSSTAGAQTYTASYLSNFITIGANGSSQDAVVGMGSIKNILTAYNGAAWTFSAADGAGFSNASVAIVLRGT